MSIKEHFSMLESSLKLCEKSEASGILSENPKENLRGNLNEHRARASPTPYIPLKDSELHEHIAHELKAQSERARQICGKIYARYTSPLQVQKLESTQGAGQEFGQGVELYIDSTLSLRAINRSRFSPELAHTLTTISLRIYTQHLREQVLYALKLEQRARESKRQEQARHKYILTHCLQILEEASLGEDTRERRIHHI